MTSPDPKDFIKTPVPPAAVFGNIGINVVTLVVIEPTFLNKTTSTERAPVVQGGPPVSPLHRWTV